MANQEFTLKSGTILKVTSAPFEVAVGLMEAVKRATRGESLELDVTDVALANPDVRKALYPAFDLVLWDTYRVGANLFDHPKVGEKARGDYFEICARVIEVNIKPFFLTISSGSMASAETNGKSQG